MIQTSQSDEDRLWVHWAAFCTGSTPTDDYHTVHSTEADAGFVREATRLCRAFHSACKTEAPPERPVLLFWRSPAGQWGITRVTRTPNPLGARTALDYYSVALPEAELRRVGSNPMLLLRTDLFELVRQQHAQRRLEPVSFPVPPAKMRLSAAPSEAGGEDPADTFEAGKRFIADHRHQQALERHCYRIARDSRVPPTFAAWWPGGHDAPEGVFEIVLRAEPEAAPEEVAFALNMAVKETLPAPPTGDASASALFDKIFASADRIQSLVDAALRNADSDAPEEWTERFADASCEAGLISADLRSYPERLKGTVRADVADRLRDLSHRYAHFAQVLDRWKRQPPRPPFPQPKLSSNRAGRVRPGREPGRGADRADKRRRLAAYSALALCALLATGAGMTLRARWSGKVGAPTLGAPVERSAAEQRIIDRAENLARNTAQNRTINRVRNTLLAGSDSLAQMKALTPAVERQVKEEVNKSVIDDVVNEMAGRHSDLNEATRRAMIERIHFGARVGVEKGARIGSQAAQIKLRKARGE